MSVPVGNLGLTGTRRRAQVMLGEPPFDCCNLTRRRDLKKPGRLARRQPMKERRAAADELRGQQENGPTHKQDTNHHRRTRPQMADNAYESKSFSVADAHAKAPAEPGDDVPCSKECSPG
jgi:hypothetical protein